MTINYDLRRAAWLYPTTPPITGPAWSKTHIRYFTIHYTGNNITYVGKDEKKVLNDIQKDYQTNRGYSFGYSSAVGLSGTTYEGRGTSFRAASNGDTSDKDDDLPGNPQLQDNLEVFSCLLIIGVPDKIPQAMIEAVRRLYASVCSELGRDLKINGHQDMDFTACPGAAAHLLINNNSFYPLAIDPDPGVDADMLVLPSPKRPIDTRFKDYSINGLTQKAGNPVGPGQFSFGIGVTNAVSAVEATVTAIPQNSIGGFLGVNDGDSFINWTSHDLHVPIPQTVTLRVVDGNVSLYISQPVHLLVSIRAEG